MLIFFLFLFYMYTYKISKRETDYLYKYRCVGGVEINSDHKKIIFVLFFFDNVIIIYVHPPYKKTNCQYNPQYFYIL